MTRQKLCSVFAIAAIVCVFADSAWAEVKTVSLPGDYADFAMNPKTGDIVALDAEKGQAVLFTNAVWQQQEVKPAKSLRTGSTPVSVFFKEYLDKQIYAVVCSQDTHMYLINAADFTLIAKVELSQGGVSHVTGSRNKKDPFIYYNYGSGHDSAAGVVSLRDNKNKGRVLGGSMDCAISADGKIAYRRGPWSPSGFESMIRISDAGAEKPVFTQLFREHRSSGKYLPGPMGRFTAAGSQIYTRSLNKNLAALDFTPMAFFPDRPVVIGTTGSSNRFSSRSRSEPIVLKAASFNTFSSIGQQVTIASANLKDSRDLPRGIRSQADYKRVSKQPRLFADGQRDRVIYADRNQLSMAPLADFDLPSEPFLIAEIEGAENVRSGETNQLTIVPHASGIEVVVDDMPAGMKRDGMKLRWTPEEAGSNTVAITLKHKDIQRTLKFEINVVHPYFSLPFAASAISTDASGKHAVIWQGMAVKDSRRMSAIAGLGGNAAAASNTTSEVAVIDLQTGKTVTTRKLATRPQHGVISGKYVIFWQEHVSPKIEILKMDDLSRHKSLVAGGPIEQLDLAGGKLVVRTSNGIEFFDAETFQRKGVFEIPTERFSSRTVRENHICRSGFYINNTLYDFDLKPQLLLHARGLPSLAGAKYGVIDTSILGLKRTVSGNAPRSSTHGVISQQLGQAFAPDSDTRVSLKYRLIRSNLANQPATNQLLIEASGGGVSARQVLSSEVSPSVNPQAPSTALAVSKTKAFILKGDHLFVWKLPAPDGAEIIPAPLQFKPAQSTLTLSAGEKTVLKHQTTGGKSPVKFALLSPFDGFEIDENTGDVTIDNARVRAEALRKLEGWLGAHRRSGTYTDALRDLAVKMIDIARPFLGRRPEGAPVAIPVQLEASDANLASTKLTYYVFTELPSKTVVARLAELDKELAAKQAAAEAARTAQTDKPAARGDAETNRRLQVLEDRIDLLTRQMNELLKQLKNK